MNKFFNKFLNILLIILICLLLLNQYYIIRFSEDLRNVFAFLTISIIFLTSVKEVVVKNSGFTKFLSIIILFCTIVGGVFSILYKILYKLPWFVTWAKHITKQEAASSSLFSYITGWSLIVSLNFRESFSAAFHNTFNISQWRQLLYEVSPLGVRFIFCARQRLERADFRPKGETIAFDRSCQRGTMWASSPTMLRMTETMK